MQNLLHTLLLLAGMFSLLGLIGYLVAGLVGLLWALGSSAVMLISILSVSPNLVLILYGAQKVPVNQLTQLNDILDWLAIRSHLHASPKLFYIPSQALIAFSVGLRKDSAIAISDGLLRALSMREMTAVLAHEISHIQSKDLWVMLIADILSRITSIMALIGYLMIVFYIPIIFYQGQSIPWLLLLLLITAPNLSAIMQLALSRTREFSADSNAINLTRDAEGLISALIKIEKYQSHWLSKIILPGMRTRQPSLLRTHPITEERIARLQSIAQDEQHPFMQQEKIISNQHKQIRSAPRRRFTGLWH